MAEPFITEKEPTRCAVFVPDVFDGPQQKLEEAQGKRRLPQAQLEEACGLAAAIDLNIVFTDVTRLQAVKPGTLYGKGKVDELGVEISENKIELVVVDHPLTPVQQRNLERAWHTKVLDRTGIILEIFGARANTKEGRLQVDLAALKHQRGRLVRSWTHLERQRGGGGFLGGPGETQIEADRRALQTKIERLEKQLDQVRRTRALHRKQRKKQKIPVVAFVGYTNAGKSTLFNKITASDVFAKDLLFATLDPTLRRIALPDGTDVILSDTVGFISDLPTDLVAAFRATLEEVTEADVIVHVRDISHADKDAQAKDVANVLLGLEVDISDPDKMAEDGRAYLEVWNKVDLLSEDEREVLENQVASRGISTLMTSAYTGEGIDALLSAVSVKLDTGYDIDTLVIAGEKLGELHHLYALGTVIDSSENEPGSVSFTVRSNRWSEIRSRFS